MHPESHTKSAQVPRERYVLPILLTAAACFFAILFAGAKLMHVAKSADAPHHSGAFIATPAAIAAR
jgi:hypothetical protein